MPYDFVLDIEELRAVAAYAYRSASEVLEIFERANPADPRPRNAVGAARDFGNGARRTKAIPDAAWAAMRAAQESQDPAATEAARAAMSAASAAYLHPIARATQVRHILGASAYAARALELMGGDAAERIELEVGRAEPTVIYVLRRYPEAPAGGGRVGELIRLLDQGLRSRDR